MDEEYIDIVFDGPPDLQAGAGRFVEVEDSVGNSIKVGRWIEEPNTDIGDCASGRTNSSPRIEASNEPRFGVFGGFAFGWAVHGMDKLYAC
jgi:hypothetical protein